MSANVTAQLSGRPLGDVVADIRQGLEGLSLPAGYTVEFAGEAHRLALLRYQAGVGTSQEVTSARDALTEREQELLHARYERYLGYLSWLLATGQRLEQTLR